MFIPHSRAIVWMISIFTLLSLYTSGSFFIPIHFHLQTSICSFGIWVYFFFRKSSLSITIISVLFIIRSSGVLNLTIWIYFNISFTYSIPINIYSLETTVSFHYFPYFRHSFQLKFTIAFRWVDFMISSISMFSISMERPYWSHSALRSFLLSAKVQGQRTNIFGLHFCPPITLVFLPWFFHDGYFRNSNGKIMWSLFLFLLFCQDSAYTLFNKKYTFF